MSIMDGIFEKAKANPQRIAFPEATEEKILLTAVECKEKGICVPVLAGNPEEIKEAAKGFGVNIEGIELFDTTDEAAMEARFEKYVAEYSELLSLKALKRKSKDAMYAALIAQAIGELDVTFAGLVHSTGEVVLGATTIIGLADGVESPSSFGIFQIPNYEGSEGNLLAFGDSAVNVAPTEAELAGIAISTCDSVKALMGWDPRCAMLSFSTDGSSEHDYVDKIRNAVSIANERRPELKIDGEFQLDTAINEKVASKKMKRESEVAGKANIIIWPDINVGNIATKCVQFFGGADAPGPFLQGFKMVVSDCSRSAPVSELVGNVAMSAVRSANK